MKIVFSIVMVCSLFLMQTGCGSSGNTVVEAPTGEINESAMEGMSEEDYDKEMEAAMNSNE